MHRATSRRTMKARRDSHHGWSIETLSYSPTRIVRLGAEKVAILFPRSSPARPGSSTRIPTRSRASTSRACPSRCVRNSSPSRIFRRSSGSSASVMPSPPRWRRKLTAQSDGQGAPRWSASASVVKVPSEPCSTRGGRRLAAARLPRTAAISTRIAGASPRGWTGRIASPP